MMPLSHSRRFRWLWIVLLILTFHPVAEVSAATFTVTNALNAGAGSLRQAVADANAAPGADVIVFDPAGAPYSIPLLSPLVLTDNAGVMIDGWSAGGAGYSGSPLVEINGTGVVGTAGILILSADNTVRGLAINRMAANAHGLVIRGAAAQNNWIYGCYVGTNTAGNVQLQNQQNGISIINGASNNLIGTNSDGVNDAAERNLVSGNRYYGVTLSTASNNRVSGNYIGTDISGTFAICNGCTGLAYGGDGVLLELGSTGNVIGTNGDGVNDAIEGNVISGTSNTNNGVFIRDAGTDNNRVAGNLIGTNAAGMTTISNGGGISITYGASHNVIGTNGDGVSDALERNVISGNTLHGVQVLEDNTTGNRISGNYIGLDSSGTLPMPNGTDGVQVVAGMLPGGPVNTIIGTDGDGSPGDAAEGNVLSGNGNYGVFIEGVDTLGSIVAGNFIGTNAAGNAAVGNHFSGVEIRNGAANTRIGTATRPAERNVISGNWGNGIIVRYDTTTNTTITGNLIGTDPSGALAVPNRGIGILAQFATNVTIGTAASGAGNTISNNWGPGIHILGAVVSVTNNVIQNNRQMGIYIEPSYGTTPDPATAADDRLPQPLIIGNQIDGNCTTIPIGCAGIYAIDTAPQNVDTLEADNTIGTNSTGNDVGQYWYGALEIISGNAPVAGAATITDNAGKTYPMTFNTTCAAVMNNTILHSISALSCANVYSWTLFTEFEVNAAGVRINHAPHTIAAPPTTYSYDADATTNPTDSGYGFIGEGITTGPFSRYQVMETTTSDPLPTVIATTPLNGAVGVALNADLTINFSEPVTASGAWFTIDCTLSGTHAAVVTGGPQDYTLNPATDFILGDVCTVTVLAASIRDLDVPQDNMAADYVFTFGVVDAPPFVASTTPANGAVDVPIADSITVTFSEAVNTGAGWFDVTCSASGTHAATVIGAAPAVTFTIDPTVDFDYNETCTVTVYAAQVSDTDLPADNMAADYTFSFTTAPVPVPGYASVPVNPGGTVSFGSVLVGQTATQTLTITETGNADLVVDSWVLVDPNFTVTSAPALPATITDGSGGNVTLTITCTPFSAGLVSTILSIRHNAPGGIADYTLTCRGFVPPPTAIPPRDSFQSGTSSFDPAISKIGFLQPGQLGINGESIEWVITVFNPTGVSGQNVVFTDTLRPELRIERVETSKGTTSTSRQTVTVSIGDLAPAETVQISIFTTVLRGGATVENTACVTADNLTGERCATGSSVGTLPATGETPLAVWWVALGILVIVSWSGWHLIRRIRD